MKIFLFFLIILPQIVAQRPPARRQKQKPCGKGQLVRRVRWFMTTTSREFYHTHNRKVFPNNTLFTQGICLPTMPYHTSGYFSVPPPSRIWVCPPTTDLQVYYTTKVETCQCFYNFFENIFTSLLGGTCGREAVLPTTARVCNLI